MKPGTLLATLALPQGAMELRVHPTFKGAHALWCPECGTVIGDMCQPYWPMDRTRAMHTRGLGHKPVYATLTQRAPLRATACHVNVAAPTNHPTHG